MSKYKFLIFLFVLLGCKFSNEYENRPSDKDDAEKITKVLYDHIRNNNFGSILDQFWIYLEMNFIKMLLVKT